MKQELTLIKFRHLRDVARKSWQRYTMLMLFMSKSLFNRPILSLRTSIQIATAVEPIINPHNLKIMGWWCRTLGSKPTLVLLAEDVRELMPAGLAVNDEESLSSPQDLVRHKEILGINFKLIDKLVKTKRQKLGKVADFSYNDGLFVQKLYVTRPVTKIFSSEDMLLIDRTQILEVTDHYVLVQDADVTEGAEEAVPARAIAAS